MKETERLWDNIISHVGPERKTAAALRTEPQSQSVYKQCTEGP